MLAQNTIQAYTPVGILIVFTAVLVAAIVGVSHLLGSGPSGPVKDSPYESGMPVIGDARRRFNVKFYLVAMMFLLFDVEVVLMWPWAVLFHTAATDPEHPISQQLAAALSVTAADASAGGAAHAPAFLLAAGGLFFGILTVGLLYDIDKGIFRWS